LGTNLTNQNYIQEEIKSQSKSGNACYHSVQNLLYSSLSKNTAFLVVLYGCETWSLILREERRQKVLQNRALRIIFGPKRDEVTGEWKKLHNEVLIDFKPIHKILFGRSNRECDGRSMLHVWGRGEVRTGFWGVNLK
jgi:hypothetical protein